MISKQIPSTMRLDDIDPAIAWQAWEPSQEEPWDLRRAALLHRRSGFAATAEQLQATMALKPDEIVSKMVRGEPIPSFEAGSFETDSAELGKSVLATSDMKQLASWWLHRMLSTPTPLIEKMTLFWHGHFATGAEKVLDVELMHTQNRLLRENALGNFRNLAQGIAKDPAMLIYLDSVTNRKAHANENFARELMELFCLGEGNYTETDVQQLAKCFTGWEIRRKQFRFNLGQHDDSMKTILGQPPIESGEAAIDCVLASPHMPKFIVRKLFRFFVTEDAEPTDAFLAPLADRFAKTNYSIASVVQMILGSRLMLSGWSIGRKVRSPVELAVGWMRTLKCSTNLGFLSDRLKTIGQAVLYPPNVKGWEGGRAWINSSTLVGRANLIYELIQNETTRFDRVKFQEFATKNGVSDSTQLSNWFAKQFFADELNAAEKENIASSFTTSLDRWASQTMIYLASRPKIHLS
ncbi:MAG: DUF1800 domain-containing protein [Planctomycetota bacterium]|nr:DUF1800 domain-containing protein [Planctomycetota bacterium]